MDADDPQLVELCTRVLGDAFHLMNRFDLPLHHEHRPASLRAAVFILDDRERERAQKIAENKGGNGAK
jgi:hypothetical protein